jgi:acetyltransferase-like isoleucine patch superfamily enzyme
MQINIAQSAIIFNNVLLADGCTIDEFVLVGVLPRGFQAGDMETRIGAGAVIRSHTVIYAGNVIGANFQTGHGVMVRESNQIGSNVSIGTHSVIEHHVQISDNVRIHTNAFIPEFSILEEGAWVGPHVVFTNALYPLGWDTKASLKGPHILPGAKIGANATLLPAVVIGQNALVGAGSVVIHDVPDGKVVAGNPARIIRDISELSSYQIDRLANS